MRRSQLSFAAGSSYSGISCPALLRKKRIVDSAVASLHLIRDAQGQRAFKRAQIPNVVSVLDARLTKIEQRLFEEAVEKIDQTWLIEYFNAPEGRPDALRICRAFEGMISGRSIARRIASSSFIEAVRFDPEERKARARLLIGRLATEFNKDPEMIDENVVTTIILEDPLFVGAALGQEASLITKVADFMTTNSRLANLGNFDSKEYFASTILQAPPRPDAYAREGIAMRGIVILRRDIDDQYRRFDFSDAQLPNPLEIDELGQIAASVYFGIAVGNMDDEFGPEEKVQFLQLMLRDVLYKRDELASTYGGPQLMVAEFDNLVDAVGDRVSEVLAQPDVVQHLLDQSNRDDLKNVLRLIDELPGLDEVLKVEIFPSLLLGPTDAHDDRKFDAQRRIIAINQVLDDFTSKYIGQEELSRIVYEHVRQDPVALASELASDVRNLPTTARLASAIRNDRKLLGCLADSTRFSSLWKLTMGNAQTGLEQSALRGSAVLRWVQADRWRESQADEKPPGTKSLLEFVEQLSEEQARRAQVVSTQWGVYHIESITTGNVAEIHRQMRSDVFAASVVSSEAFADRFTRAVDEAYDLRRHVQSGPQTRVERTALRYLQQSWRRRDEGEIARISAISGKMNPTVDNIAIFMGNDPPALARVIRQDERVFNQLREFVMTEAGFTAALELPGGDHVLAELDLPEELIALDNNLFVRWALGSDRMTPGNLPENVIELGRLPELF